MSNLHDFPRLGELKLKKMQVERKLKNATDPTGKNGLKWSYIV